MKTNILKLKIDNYIFKIFHYLFNKSIRNLWALSIFILFLKVINPYFLIDIILIICLFSVFSILILLTIYESIEKGMALLNHNVKQTINEIIEKESK